MPLTGRLKDLNAVFVVDGDDNPIATYPVSTLPLPGHSPILSLLYAELHLTFPNVDALVQNDREKLVSTPTTNTILSWTAERLWEQVAAVEEQQKSKERKSELHKATVLNDALNQHAKHFLQELQTQIMVDFIDDPAGGGFGNVGTGKAPTGEGSRGDGPRDRGTGGDTGEGGTAETPGTLDRSRRSRFPQVLLSGIDEDPANPGESKHFTDRHPPLEQDDVDKFYNVWWINTVHPYAQAALERGGSTASAFRCHQLTMFRDVVQREALRLLQRREAELGLDRVENELSEASNRFLAELPHDLVVELLD